MMTMKASVKDDWVRAALTDDGVVVELLVRLKQTQEAKSMVTPLAALRWGIRQPRSRSLRCDAVSQRGKEGDSTNSARASPTTPLSWSGGGGAASPSATGDAFEETSRHRPSSARSKSTIATSETTSNSTKRSRRKKTFAELKEEEDSLLKERIYLNKEIETLRATCEEFNARNKNLKRMKLDLGLPSTKNYNETTSEEPEKTVSDLVHKRVASSLENLPSSSNSTVVNFPQSDSSEGNKTGPTSNSNGGCLLPDLNMMPCEDDSGSETLYGMS